MGTCWSPMPIPEAHVHGPTMNPPATWIPTELWPQRVEVHVGTSHRSPFCTCTSRQPLVLGLTSLESRPDTRTIDLGTAVGACILGKEAERLLQALNWLENLLKGTKVNPPAATAVGRLVGASRPGCPHQGALPGLVYALVMALEASDPGDSAAVVQVKMGLKQESKTS